VADSPLLLPFSLQLVPSSARVLNSWKEIATYLGRGVRTVQRWEQDLSLPVHRPRGGDRTAVLALPRELDEWLRRTPLHDRNGSDAANFADFLLDVARDLLEQAERLVSVDKKHPIEAAQVADSVRKIVNELTLMSSGVGCATKPIRLARNKAQQKRMFVSPLQPSASG
jgi:hypothetical protein